MTNGFQIELKGNVHHVRSKKWLKVAFFSQLFKVEILLFCLSDPKLKCFCLDMMFRSCFGTIRYTAYIYVKPQ
jgi:hypothetical protein